MLLWKDGDLKPLKSTQVTITFQIVLKLPWKKRKILRLGFTLVEIMHTKTFWVVFTTLCRECRCWPCSLSAPSSRSALGWNALVSLRVEHLSHTTSFLHFLPQSERALHEVHKKFLRSYCKCFRIHGVFYWGSVVAFISFFGLAYGRYCQLQLVQMEGQDILLWT